MMNKLEYKKWRVGYDIKKKRWVFTLLVNVEDIPYKRSQKEEYIHLAGDINQGEYLTLLKLIDYTERLRGEMTPGEIILMFETFQFTFNETDKLLGK